MSEPLPLPVLPPERERDSVLRHVDAPGRLQPDVTHHRRRRPSGEPPPLPRPLHRTGAFWVVAAGAALIFYIVNGVTEGLTSPGSRVDHSILVWFERHRTEDLNTLMRTVHALGSVWVIRVFAYVGVL